MFPKLNSVPQGLTIYSCHYVILTKSFLLFLLSGRTTTIWMTLRVTSTTQPPQVTTLATPPPHRPPSPHSRQAVATAMASHSPHQPATKVSELKSDEGLGRNSGECSGPGGTFLAATKQLHKWYFPSVRLSVRLSVCLSVTPFWLCSHHPIIMKFSGVITNDQSKVHAKGQGQRSKVKVTEVTTRLNRFRTVTPVWIHIWWWNHAYGLMILRRGALLFLKVIRQISRSHDSKKRRVWPRLGVSGL